MKTHGLLGKCHLLLLDAHKSHVYNIRFILICKRFNIDVLAIPSHTSHIIQPLDSVPFANLKTAWNEELIDYLFHSVGLGFSKMEFFEVFIPAWKKSMTPQNIRAGFRETGICPFNPLIIHPSSLGPSEPTPDMAYVSIFMDNDLTHITEDHFEIKLSARLLDQTHVVQPSMFPPRYDDAQANTTCLHGGLARLSE